MSIRAVSDTSGNIVKEITYDIYGNILSDTNANFKVPFGFAGGLYDTDTKLVRFGYRDYDSYTGKWTAKDPIDFGGGAQGMAGIDFPSTETSEIGECSETKKCTEDWVIEVSGALSAGEGFGAGVTGCPTGVSVTIDAPIGSPGAGVYGGIDICVVKSYSF